LPELLREHIQGAGAVLQAAKNDDKAALDKVVKECYANGNEPGDFLATANPKN
jgi:hypothetical protein